MLSRVGKDTAYAVTCWKGYSLYCHVLERIQPMLSRVRKDTAYIVTCSKGYSLCCHVLERIQPILSRIVWVQAASKGSHFHVFSAVLTVHAAFICAGRTDALQPRQSIVKSRSLASANPSQITGGEWESHAGTAEFHAHPLGLFNACVTLT